MLLGAAISALLSFNAPDLGSRAALSRLVPSFAAARLQPTRAAVRELIEGLDIDMCSRVSYDGHTALRICRSYSKRYTGGSRVPRIALSDIQIDAHDVERDLIRQALVAFRTAAADTGHVLVVEDICCDRVLALVKLLGGEILPIPGRCDYWLRPPGRAPSQPPFGFAAAWQELSVDA